MLVLSCSKTEEIKINPAAIIGGEIYRSQIVTVTLNDNALTENDYKATLGGVAVTLTKLDANKLLLPVNFAVPLGLKDLVIPSLNNLTIRYDVKDTVLSATADATMEPFITKLATYSTSLDNSPNSLSIQKSIVSFNAVYANLTPAEKTEMAIIYKTNKDIIDPIFVGDFSKFSKKSKANDNIITLFVLHKAAVLGIAAGAVLFELGTHPGVKVFGAVLAGVSTGFAIEHFGNIITNRFVALGIVFDGIVGVNNRISNNTATSISFQNDVEKTVNFNTNNRTLNSSDSIKTQSDLASFFQFSTKYNKIINNINTQITWVNSNVIFANFSLLPLEVMPATSSTTNVVANQTIFSKIKFTVSDPNLSLISSSLSSEGKLNLKIKIVGTPASLPVESFINYSYSDDFSTFSGKLPIKVTDVEIGEWFEGTYTLDHWGSSPQSNASYNCGSQYGEKGKIYFYKTSDKLVCFAKSILAEFPDFLVASKSDNYLRRWIKPTIDNGLDYANWEIYVYLSNNSCSGDGYAAIPLLKGDPRVCDANNNYKYFYDITISTQSIGFDPPLSLSAAEVKKITDLPISLQF